MELEIFQQVVDSIPELKGYKVSPTIHKVVDGYPHVFHGYVEFELHAGGSYSLQLPDYPEIQIEMTPKRIKQVIKDIKKDLLKRQAPSTP